MSDNNITIRRRTILKGTAATLGTGLAGTVSGSDGDNRVRFVEAGVVNRVSNPQGLKYADRDIDCFPPKYDVRPEGNTLRVDADRITDEERTTLNERETVIYSDGFADESTPVSGGTTRSLVTELSARLQPHHVVKLSESYTEPEVAVGVDEQISVSTEFSKENLEPGIEVSHRFSERNATVKKQKPTDTPAIRDKDVKSWRQSTEIEKWSEKLRVRPEVKVRDYGLLEVEFV